MTEKNRNLLIRVVTAAVLLPLVLWLIWLGGLAFAILIGVAAALCALELNLLPTSLPPPEPPKKNPVAEEIEELELESAVLSGAATPLDVIDAQQALSQAENIRNQALVSHANARATLQYVTGRNPLE